MGPIRPKRLSAARSPMLSLQQYGFPRSFECFPVCSDDADFSSVESRELYRHPEERVLVILVVRGERVLMDNHRVGFFTAGLNEVRQQTGDLRRESRFLFA